MRRGTAIRRTARVMRGETAVAAAALKALRAIGATALDRLQAAGMDPSVLDNRDPVWQQQVDEVLLPAIADVYAAGWKAEARTPVTAAAEPAGLPEPFIGGEASLSDERAAQYLLTARNRLVNVSDTVFQQITTALQEGRDRKFDAYTLPDGREVPARIGESIPELSARVNALLGDGERWKNRATVIARTEVISANNAGSHAAAAYNAEVLGHSDQDVVKEWLATPGPRTRETHAEANGQQVKGLSTPFVVGDAYLQEPGDPTGPAEEVVQCRCTALYHYPGDPDYPGDGDITTQATGEPSSGLPEETGRAPLPTPVSDLPEIPDEVIAALQPPRGGWTTSTRGKTVDALRKTAEGRSLMKTLDSFQSGGATAIPRLRTDIEKFLAGEDLPEGRRDAIRHLLSAVSRSEAPIEKSLWRGMSIPGTPADVLAHYAAGSEVNLSLASFSQDKALAQSFTKGGAGKKVRAAKQTPVLVEWAGSKRAVPVAALSKSRVFANEKEWIGSGRYRVVSSSLVKRGGVETVVVKIEQGSTW